MTATPSAPIDADLIVVGSGFAGALTALAFRRTGRRVVLVERGRHRGEDSSQLLHRSQSSFSSPTVKRSGRVGTFRAASRTPGMKDWRSIESWRIARVCPGPPKITSWWATRPGSRTEWIGRWTWPPAASIS